MKETNVIPLSIRCYRSERGVVAVICDGRGACLVGGWLEAGGRVNENSI